jgi:tRNA pseudouridine38/39 synthase
MSNSLSNSDFYQLYCFTISGKAFLWHQVRCMTHVLFAVGQGQEKPEVVKEMLDLEETPRKPAYDFASELPLILWDCGYEDVQWMYDIEYHPAQMKHYFNLWNQSIIKSCLVHLSLQHLENTLFNNTTRDGYTPYKLLPKPNKAEKYTPLSRRPKLGMLG